MSASLHQAPRSIQAPPGGMLSIADVMAFVEAAQTEHLCETVTEEQLAGRSADDVELLTVRLEAEHAAIRARINRQIRMMLEDANR